MSIAKVSDILLGICGKHGGLVIDYTDSHIGNWVKILITESEAITTLTGITFSAGTELFGDFTVIDLASGSCIAYNR